MVKYAKLSMKLLGNFGEFQIKIKTLKSVCKMQLICRGRRVIYISPLDPDGVLRSESRSFGISILGPIGR
jgi:hypothetical protein